MITRINAELDSIETAELAARMIKQKTDGLISIKIKSNISNIKNEDEPFIIPSYSQGNNFYFYPQINNDINSFNNSNEFKETSRTAIIEVICNKESEKIVSQVFISLGGLKINKN